MKLLSISAAIIAFIIILLWRIDVLSNRITQADMTEQYLIQELSKSKQQVATILGINKLNHLALTNYYTRISDVESLLSRQEKELKRLINDNKTLNDWANTVLPADIIRLRQRPAINGAADYYQYLSSGDGMPVP